MPHGGKRSKWFGCLFQELDEMKRSKSCHRQRRCKLAASDAHHALHPVRNKQGSSKEEPYAVRCVRLVVIVVYGRSG